MKMFFKRFCAYMIDTVILAVAFFILGFVLGDTLPIIEQTIAFYIVTILYFAVLEAGNQQATIGKRMLGLRVYDMNGDKISLPRAIWRNIARLINYPIFCLGYLLIIFTKKQQGLHDLMARTLVIADEDLDEEYEEEDN